MNIRKQLKEAWISADRANLALLQTMDEVRLNAKSNGRSRTVRRIWVHMHNARINWVKSFGKGKCDLPRLRASLAHSPEELAQALAQSSDAVLALLKEVAKREKIKILEKSPMTLLAMMVAHDAHHRGQMLAILRERQLLPGREVLEGLWDWQE
jgi:uncharacterized damage-inducible protein DinB